MSSSRMVIRTIKDYLGAWGARPRFRLSEFRLAPFAPSSFRLDGWADGPGPARGRRETRCRRDSRLYNHVMPPGGEQGRVRGVWHDALA